MCPLLVLGTPYLANISFIGWMGIYSSWLLRGVDLVKKIIRMIVLTDSHYGEAQPGFWFIKSLFHGSLLVCLLTIMANNLRIQK